MYSTLLPPARLRVRTLGPGFTNASWAVGFGEYPTNFYDQVKSQWLRIDVPDDAAPHNVDLWTTCNAEPLLEKMYVDVINNCPEIYVIAKNPAQESYVSRNSPSLYVQTYVDFPQLSLEYTARVSLDGQRVCVRSQFYNGCGSSPLRFRSIRPNDRFEITCPYVP